MDGNTCSVIYLGCYKWEVSKLENLSNLDFGRDNITHHTYCHIETFILDSSLNFKESIKVTKSQWEQILRKPQNKTLDTIEHKGENITLNS